MTTTPAPFWCGANERGQNMTETQKASFLYKELRHISDLIHSGKGISYGDIAFLNENQTEIKEYFPDDIELWQWAGIDESERS